MGSRNSADKTVNWLQLSDLHVFKEANTFLILESYKELAKILHPHFAVVSGDFRHIKGKTNYSETKEYLESVLDIFEIKKEDVFLVPGNHDTNKYPGRTSTIGKIIDSIEGKYDCYRDYLDDRHSLHDGFSEYSAFVRSFYENTTVDDDRVNNPDGVFCIPWKKKINLLHVNTALISDGNRNHKEIVDINRIAEILHTCDSSIPTILLGHHGLQSLYDSQRNVLQAVIQQFQISAFLHGDIHVYENKPIQHMIPNTSLPEIACAKSAPQAGDNTSDIGIIYYTWKEDDNTIVKAYQWNGKTFMPNTSSSFYYGPNKPYYFPMLYNKEPVEAKCGNDLNEDQCSPLQDSSAERNKTEHFKKTGKNPVSMKDSRIARGNNSSGIIPMQRGVVTKGQIQHGAKTDPINILITPLDQIDSLASNAFNRGKSQLLINAILKQSDHITTPFSTILEHILGSTTQFPLIIKGEPGTGKSSLLSLICLRIRQDSKYSSRLSNIIHIDLHAYDDMQLNRAVKELKTRIEQITKSVKAYPNSLVLIDGINEFVRRENKLQKMLLKAIPAWKELRARFVLSIGMMSAQDIPPFIHSEDMHFRTTMTICLNPLDTTSKEFAALTKNVLRLFSVMPSHNNNQNKQIDKIISYCKKIDGNSSYIRTVVFLVKRFGFYSQDSDGIFSNSCGKVLLDYYSRQLNFRALSNLAEKTAAFMVGKHRYIPSGYHAIPYKSAAIRDFLFALAYVDELIDTKENNYYILDRILTSRINRFVIDLILEKENQNQIVSRIISLFPSATTKAKSQLTYLLGRLQADSAKQSAKEFLHEKYDHYRDKVCRSEATDEEALLFRSIGVSLVYLDSNEFSNDFFKLLIYNQSMSTINRNFHIAYYTMSLNEINNTFAFGDNSICTKDSVHYLYSFLHHSIDNTPDPARQCINIITLINLVIQGAYSSNDGTWLTGQIPDEFLNLLGRLASDTRITNSVVKDYIINVKGHLGTQNVYVQSFNDLYSLKKTVRSGWTKTGREISLPESVADHSWGCGFLAQLVLTDRPEDCEFFGVGDLQACKSGYDKDRIIQMLLIHDLPEVVTGDIPTQEKDSKNRNAEADIMKGFRVLGVFPGFRQFHNLADLWDEYNAGNTINAKIAQDIDHLEPLVQLFVYRNQLSAEDVRKERDGWIEVANSKLHTDFGRTVFHFLTGNLLTDALFDSVNQRTEKNN